MNKIFMLSVAVALGLLFSQFAGAITPTPNELALAHNWTAAHFDGEKDAKDVPAFFSFLYDGKPSAELLKTWDVKRSSRKIDDRRTERTLVYADPKTGLELRLIGVEYHDFPAIEWTLYFKNTSDKDTPILEQIRPLDLRIEGQNADGIIIHHNLGDSNSGQSFAPVDDLLTTAKPGPLVLAPVGGRSSDGHLPYFNVDWKTGGIAAAIGWSGQWEAAFEMNSAGALQFRAGQQLTHLKLLPGETIRTPKILFVFWESNQPIRGNNLFRQLMLAHCSPRKNGSLVMPPICACVGWTDEKGCYEKPHVDAMKPMAERGIEVLWSDMDPQQWYPKGFPEGTGTWLPDPAKYPNGLKPVGDAAKAAGIGYLLWFEPERVAPGSKIDVEHPEFVLKANGEWSQLFRLNDEKARKWLTDHIDVQITAAQLAWLRWDYNIPPLGFWRRNDEPDRQGITEIRYIEGLYAMWDDLLARHPGLMIDNCASGGRRIDIETCSRSIPLWHSDMQCEGPKPAADQLQNGGLTRWVPLHGCGNFGLEPSYTFCSQMTAGNALVTAFSQASLSGADGDTAEAVKKTVALYNQLRPLMVGDFYPLLPHDESESQWYGYQFDNPQQHAGCVIVFRREKCSETSKSILLFGVDPTATYEITNADTSEKIGIAGCVLLETGLPISIKDQPGSSLITYKKKP